MHDLFAIAKFLLSSHMCQWHLVELGPFIHQICGTRCSSKLNGTNDNYEGLLYFVGNIVRNDRHLDLPLNTMFNRILKNHTRWEV